MFPRELCLGFVYAFELPLKFAYESIEDSYLFSGKPFVKYEISVAHVIDYTVRRD